SNAAVPGDGVRRVTIKELETALADKSALVVDVRDETSYKNGHIKGALSIPLADLPNRLSDLPKDKLIVFYCA
ncbi:MAG: rhodanese-like domain-containing protein, partial [Pyrinomonadaceae bacterium]